MSQGANQISTTPPLPGATLASQANAALAALLTSYSGPSAPSSPSPQQSWIDTSGAPIWLLKTWDGAQWILDGAYDTTNHQFYGPIGGGTATLASAATVNLGSVNQSQITVTGSNAITSFGSSAQAGQIKFVTFAGALTLTHNASTLVLPGMANITTGAGDTCIAVSQGGGAWVVWNYTTAGGTPQGIRTRLTGPTTYYVRTDGNDANDGTQNNAAHAFRNPQRAYDFICANLDLGGQTVTVQIGDGTYTVGLTASSPWAGGGNVTFTGNAVTPDNVVISVSAANSYCFFVNGIVLPGTLTVQHMKLTTSGSAISLLRNGGVGTFNFGNITFGATNGNVIDAVGIGANLTQVSPCRLTSLNGQIFSYAQSQAQIFIRGSTLTLGPGRINSTGLAFCWSTSLSLIAANVELFNGAQTVTMTIASPAVVNWTGHPASAGDVVVFNTTGALPTGVVAGQQYFVIAAGLTANSFQFSATFGGAAVNTSGSQSGVHNAFIAAGPRYFADKNSVVTTSGGANYLPGSAAGSTTLGAQYD